MKLISKKIAPDKEEIHLDGVDICKVSAS
ncbi:MAG: hypothetical protein LBI63_01365 [Candidatus Ancillula sp.]|nr:hypothetical protein [Candidatus Ancillula sp.]